MLWTSIALAALAGIAVVEMVAPPTHVYLGLLVAPPLIAAGRGRPATTAWVAACAVLTAALLGIPRGIWLTADHAIRVGAVVLASSGAVAIAFVRDRVERSLAQSERVQAAQYRISEAAHTASTLQELFAAIHGIVGELMPAKNFYIALYDQPSDTVSFPYFVDEEDESFAPMHPGKTLTGYVLRTGRPALVTPRVARELETRGEVELIGAPSIDWLGVPLLVQGRAIGVLVVQSYTEGVRYRDAERNVLQFVSSQVAMAIERKRAQEGLRESEDRYRRVVELSPDAIIVHSEGLVVFANAAAARLVGAAAPSAIVGRSVLDFVHPDYRSVVVERVREMVDQGARAPLIAERFLRLDGTPVEVEVQAGPLAYQGRPAIQVVARDVGERRRAEEQLRTQAAALNAAANSILLMDLEGRIEWANRALLNLTGYSAAEIAGQGPRLLRGADDDPEFAERLWRTLRDGQVWRGPMANRRRDGTGYVVDLTITPLRDERGRVVRFLAVGQDVTEHRRAQEQLGIQAAALEAVANPIIICDRDLNIIWVNPAFVQLTGYGLDEVVGQSPRFLRGEGGEFDDTERAVRSGKPWRGEVGNRRKDGSRFLVDVAFTPVLGEHGEIIRFVGVAQDVTERRRLEEQLRQAQKMEAVGELAGGVAHDFNNLLTAVLASSELLADEVGSLPRGSEEVDTIREAARYGADLTQKLLAFSRRQPLELRPLALGAVVTDFTRMARRLMPDDVEISVSVGAPGSAIRADPGAIEQILMNLLTNGRDAMPSGGRLTIDVRRGALDEAHRLLHGWGDPGDYVVLAVTDTGCGMDAETQRRVFEPFFTTKPVGRGTGLGMAMVYGLVKQHRGFVQVESETGRGTTVRVYFPGSSEEGVGAVEPRLPEARGGTETVLLVEDNESVRGVATRALQKHGYTVLNAEDGRDALRLLATLTTPPDLIISDVVMPHTSGPQLYDALRASGHAPRMLFTSGHASREVDERVVLGGRVPFLPKPWSVRDLLRRVREVLDAPAT
jgi:PAS domain S-box-containing protein